MVHKLRNNEYPILNKLLYVKCNFEVELCNTDNLVIGE